MKRKFFLFLVNSATRGIAETLAWFPFSAPSVRLFLVFFIVFTSQTKIFQNDLTNKITAYNL